jgi:hypothetical protein
MDKKTAIETIEACFCVMRENSNQYGVPEWKFQKVHEAMNKAENALKFFKKKDNTVLKMEPEVRNSGMKCQKIERQAFFYLIENCSSCGLDHEIYEGDLHFLINSIDGNLAFTCPHDHTYVEIGVV